MKQFDRGWPKFDLTKLISQNKMKIGNEQKFNHTFNFPCTNDNIFPVVIVVLSLLIIKRYLTIGSAVQFEFV